MTEREASPEWYVDLGDFYCIDRVEILAKQGCNACLRNLQKKGVFLHTTTDTEDRIETSSICGRLITLLDFINPVDKITRSCDGGRGRYVGIRGFHLEDDKGTLELCEVKVFATDACN
ncbi:uncharacterized protein [Amphiura filiformis]|uniref:uncharacterized protein n=1 Tax=Amphiura filiformis TaxID=82378 RepID=UPI003B221CE1